MEFENIKFIVSEIDGVITEHLAAIGEVGITLFKQFCMKDFEAINLIKKDYGFAFISSDANINMSLCKKKNIAFFYAEKSKKEMFSKLLNRFSLTPDNVLYVGSAYSDIECIRLSGISMCPEDSVAQVRKEASHIIPVYSGNGVLSYLYDFIEKNRVLA